MKRLFILACAVFLIVSAFSSRNFISSIYGTIEPAEAAKKVWAVNGKDSVSVIPEAGKFSIAVTAGKWKLTVEANRPYQDAVIENINVEEGKSTDAGIIRLIAK
jgi:hypothetical protein